VIKVLLPLSEGELEGVMDFWKLRFGFKIRPLERIQIQRSSANIQKKITPPDLPSERGGIASAHK